MTKSNHNFNLVPHYQQGELVTFRGQLFASTAAAHLFLYRHSWEIIKTGDGCRLLNVGFCSNVAGIVYRIFIQLLRAWLVSNLRHFSRCQIKHKPFILDSFGRPIRDRARHPLFILWIFARQLATTWPPPW
jgi:hypothetical protein